MVEHSNVCWKCGASVCDEVSCPACDVLLPPSDDETHFSVFGMKPGVKLSKEILEERFFELSRRFHPDFYSDESPEEQAISLDRSSRLNDAYRILGDLFLRLEYLLSLYGRSLDGTDGGWKPPPDMLMQVFELNELLENIRSAHDGGDKATIDSSMVELDSIESWLRERKTDIDNGVMDVGVSWEATQGLGQENTEALDTWQEQLARLAYIRNLLGQIAAVRLG